MTRRETVRLLAVGVSLPLLAGCGGGNNTTTSRGAAEFTIRWPEPSRLIPAAAQSIRLVLTAGGKTVAQQTVARPPAGQNTSIVSFRDLLTGDVTVTATAYPNPDGTGVAQASGSMVVTVVGNQVVSNSLVMGSTIAQVVITPSTVSVSLRNSVSLIATATDAAGSIVLMSPGAMQWSSASPAVAMVDPNGKVTGVAVGTAQITVSDAESGKSALPVKVSVTGGFQPNLVTNGSFETPLVSSLGPYPNGIEITAPFDFGDWILDQGSVDLVGGKGYYQVAQGNQALFLSGGNAGSVYQYINTTPGQSYRLRFAMSGDPGKPGFPLIKHMEVRWGDTVVATPEFDITLTSPANMGWVYKEYIVTATTSVTRLRLSSLDNDPTGPSVDDVSVTVNSG